MKNFIKCSFLFFTVMKMKAVYPDAKKFSVFISILSNVVDEVLFEFDENGFNVKALDPCRVIFLKVSVPASAFEEYSVDGRETVGVNLQFLSKVLKRGKKGEKLVIETGGNMMIVSLVNRVTRSFKSGVVDVAAEDLELPEIEFQTRGLVEGRELFEAVKDVSLMDETVQLKTENGSLIVEGVESTSSVHIVLESSIEGEESRASYGISYLMDILKGLKDADIMVEFGSDMLLHMSAEIDGGKVDVLLAPRVEE